ncbi:pachytene checkpoint protein 2 homolog [Anoplophora glabripennis]|uniref:pachytene checkpoint protein 2 homolog n=1 Tax=Anoplophora glabripennis TaxID=217634 RepID=UPI0008736793|nr:pachytene checkpoint protein 2 homolog [Anoplophora glabripennis]
MKMSNTIDIEIILNAYIANISKKSIIDVVQCYLEKNNVRPNSVISNFDHPILHNDVKTIIVGDTPNYTKAFIDFNTLEVKWYVYNLDNYGPMTHSETDANDEELVLATHLSLPSASLINLWENLYYDNNVKLNLLKYSQTMMEFSDKGVDCNVVSCNRVILLHGPPGTGKTSLCKALAHKLTIRMSERFTSGLLIEINSHSLFSKWFSESGKLVTKMFTKIKEILEDNNILVCVLIDEVESLAHARDQCVSGNEPSDSIRVVNAVLTQVDQIKLYPNVLILATSNMTETIDIAFVDRADIKQYLGNPSGPAIYKIYYSCIQELFKAQIIREQALEPIESLVSGQDTEFIEESRQLLRVCEKSLGLSGRSLRKIPFLAHALFIDKSLVTLTEFLVAMEKAVENEHAERHYFKNFKVEK